MVKLVSHSTLTAIFIVRAYVPQPKGIKMKVKIKCDYCHKEFELDKTIYNKRRKKSSHLYCSHNCSCLARRVRVQIECAVCGKKIERKPSAILGNLSFCSHSCANGYNNRFKKKDSENTYRRQAMEQYPHQCFICGWDKDKRILEVHHIDENRKNNDITNLMILCPICHRYLTLHLYTIEELKNIIWKGS